LDPVRYTKLLEYSLHLEKQGNQFEKESDEAGAIPIYIKMVDALLLLAEVAPNYPTWQKFTDKAESYQKRTKILIAKAAAKIEGDSKQHSEKVEISVPCQSQLVQSE